VYGFYSKDSLEYLVHQRANKKPLATVEPKSASSAHRPLEPLFDENASRQLIVVSVGETICVSPLS
jgi:hypothetical protein